MSTPTPVDDPRSGVGRTLVDHDAERLLADRGYVVVDLLDEADIARLAEIADRLLTHQRTGFHASNITGSAAYRTAVDREVRPIVEAAVVGAGLFVDHEAYTSSLLVKWPGEDSAFHTHQDWNMVAEDRYRTVNVWCPLVDTDEGNGALAVLPHSHRHLGAIRCSPVPPESHRSPGWDVTYDDMVKVPVRAGQAIVFDHALLHSSPPNLTSVWRPAVAAAFKPRSARLLHWYLADRDAVDLEVFEIDSAFFTEFRIGDRPDYPVVASATFRSDDLTTRELMDRCGVPMPEPEPEVVEPVPAGPATAEDQAVEDAAPLDAAGALGPAEIRAVDAAPSPVTFVPAYKRTRGWRLLRRLRARTASRGAVRRG